MLVVGLFAGAACAATYYVTETGGGNGTSWASPTNSIQGAIANGDATLVLVSNGTYGITAQITVSKAVTVSSFGNGVTGGLANAENTVVQRSGGMTRIFSITHADAVVEGLTIRNGNWSFGNNGNGVYMTGGLVRDCIIRDNGYGDLYLGAGVYMTGGTVSNCIVRSNGGNFNVSGGGVYATGGQILYCQILDNALTGAGNGGGVYASGAGGSSP